jgi:hypothetical protein
MNSDYVIGTRNPGIIMERYVNDMRDNDRIAYPASEEKTTEASAAVQQDGHVNMAAIEVRPDDADIEVGSSSETGRRERGRGPEVQEADLSFEDVLDILNPLQHLPIVSHIYRAVSGDEIKGFAQIAGNAIFGGPIGIISGAFNAMFEDETGSSPIETMVAGLFGLGEEKPEDATLETQLAEAEHNVVTDEEAPAQVQLASNTKLPKTLNEQVAGAMLPPVPPEPAQHAAVTKAPFGGIMDMSTIKAASQQAAAAQNNEAPRASPLPGSTAAAHPPTEINGQKFYSLSGVRRTGEGAPAMPIHSGPDVRLKPISRQANSGVLTPTQSITAAPKIADPEAAKALGLAMNGSSVAELGLKDTPPLLTPGDADLLPAYGGGSQAVPPALIEDMMKMGLDKYQQGIDSGAINSRPGVDIRG